MRQHALAADDAAREDVAAERDHGVDLRIGKIPIAVLVARVRDLDAD